jgi:type II secretory pathway pseudopilin PulG
MIGAWRGKEGQRGWSLLEAVAAIVVVGLGVSLFVKVQGMSRRGNTTNSKVLVAGKLIEGFLEDTRITIARDTIRNWPPVGRTVAAAPPHNIKVVSVVSSAASPKDGAVVANVVRMDITASWTQPYADTLKVTTYVAKRF